MTVPEIAAKVGMSEGAVQSVVSMLASQGKLRIAAVEVHARRALTSIPLRAYPGGESVAG